MDVQKKQPKTRLVPHLNVFNRARRYAIRPETKTHSCTYCISISLRVQKKAKTRPPCGAHRVFIIMSHIVVLSSDSDDVFEPSRSRTAVVTNRRGRNHGDVDVDAAD